jgi:hypothetical protein
MLARGRGATSLEAWLGVGNSGCIINQFAVSCRVSSTEAALLRDIPVTHQETTGMPENLPFVSRLHSMLTSKMQLTIPAKPVAAPPPTE